MYSIFGPGYIGGRYCEMYPGDTIPLKRYQRNPESKEIIYFISTIDNSNIYTDIGLDVETNLSVLCQTLQYCKDADIVFNFISSWFVYGDVELPAREDVVCKPRGFYSITKKCAEDLLIDFCRTFKVKYRILRMPNVVGGYDPKASPKKNAIHYLIDELKKNNDITLYNDGNIIKDIMHVDDVCRAINRVVNRGEFNTIYNIGSGQQTTLGDIIRRAKRYMGSDSKILSRKADTQDMFLDSTKLMELGFKPQKSHFDIISELCTN